MVSRFSLALLYMSLSLPPLVNAAELAPLFSGSDLNTGHEIRLADYRGKVVLLDFWASWCAPCLVSLPAYDELRTELGTEDFDVISVNVDAKIQDAIDFLEERPVSFPVVIDSEGDIGIPYRIRTLPRAFLLNRNGEIVASYSSFNEEDKATLRQSIVELMGKPN